jgi:hypothetical protein
VPTLPDVRDDVDVEVCAASDETVDAVTCVAESVVAAPNDGVSPPPVTLPLLDVVVVVVVVVVTIAFDPPLPPLLPWPLV